MLLFATKQRRGLDIEALEQKEVVWGTSDRVWGELYVKVPQPEMSDVEENGGRWSGR